MCQCMGVRNASCFLSSSLFQKYLTDTDKIPIDEVHTYAKFCLLTYCF